MADLTTEEIQKILKNLTCGIKREEDSSYFGDGIELKVAKLAVKALRQLTEEKGWKPIDTAPKDGSAFLAYGRHTVDDPYGAQRGVKAGDHWWGIILYDVWREIGMGGGEFVFAKDGARTWSEPTHWRPLPSPPDNNKEN